MGQICNNEIMKTQNFLFYIFINYASCLNLDIRVQVELIKPENPEHVECFPKIEQSSSHYLSVDRFSLSLISQQIIAVIRRTTQNFTRVVGYLSSNTLYMTYARREGASSWLRDLETHWFLTTANNWSARHAPVPLGPLLDRPSEAARSIKAHRINHSLLHGN